MKITDKMRLDWLTRQTTHTGLDLDIGAGGELAWSLSEQTELYKSPRAAIDAAMKFEKRSQK